MSRAALLAVLALTALLLVGTACGGAPGQRFDDQSDQTAIVAVPFTQSTRATEADVTELATITAQELKTLLDASSKAVILDVRLRASYDSGHIPGAISLPIDELDAPILQIPRDGLLVCYCSGGP